MRFKTTLQFTLLTFTIILIISCNGTKTNDVHNDSITDIYMSETQNYDSISTKIASEFRKYQDFIINEDYESVMNYFYPGLPEDYAENFLTYMSHINAPLIRYNTFFDSIEKMVQCDSKYLIRYSRVTYHYSIDNNSDSTKIDKYYYGFALSLDNGNNWFFFDEAFSDMRNSLKKDFCPADIEYVLKRD